MVVVTVAASSVWFVGGHRHAPPFVGAAQLAVTATFMLLGLAFATRSVNSLLG
jgi:hypothetical protein